MMMDDAEVVTGFQKESQRKCFVFSLAVLSCLHQYFSQNLDGQAVILVAVLYNVKCSLLMVNGKKRQSFLYA
jgi:hypothetical protein